MFQVVEQARNNNSNPMDLLKQVTNGYTPEQISNLFARAKQIGVPDNVLEKMPEAKKRTISIEVGMQNAGLATVLATKHFAFIPEAASDTNIYIRRCIEAFSINDQQQSTAKCHTCIIDSRKLLMDIFTFFIVEFINSETTQTILGRIVK